MRLLKLNAHGLGNLTLHAACQVPNFLLAAPVLAISLSGCHSYFSTDCTRALSLGFRVGALCGCEALAPTERLDGARTTTICHS